MQGHHRPAYLAALVPLALSLALAGCKDGTENIGSDPVPASRFGNNGCNGDDNVYVSPMLTYTDAARIGAMSQLAALAPPLDPMDPVEDKLYVSGADTSILELDYSADPRSPVVTVVVPAGIIDALLGAIFTPAPAAEISGIAVLDPSNLIVAEHTSNSLLLVNLVNPVTVNSVVVYVGRPDLTPSYVDGVGGATRFSFPAGLPTQICPTGDLRILVADRGNHAIREVQLGQTLFTRTIAGTGVPFHGNGSLAGTGFDTPAGLTVSCPGEVIVSEVGPAGHRLRSIQIGPDGFLGAPTGASMTLAGDGTPATADGVGAAATLNAPLSPVTSSEGEIYWVDAGSGILRRMSLGSGVVDCPNPDFVDCAAAVAAGGGFSGAGNYAAAISASGYLYVLDGTAGTISLVSDAP